MENNIYSVGAGKSNAYLIMDEKIVIVDGVTADSADKYIENIKNLTDKADYVIFNNTCPNHSGSFKKLLEAFPGIEVIASVAGIRSLKEIANCDFREHLAKDGAELNIGNKPLKFLITPNLPSPDSMMTYMDGILFSGNAFSSENENFTSIEEYYEDKLSSFAPFVKTMTERIKTMDIRAIYPAEGRVLTELTANAVELYGKLSRPSDKSKTVILYCSNYGATREMAETISGVLENAECIDLMKTADISETINSAKALIIGTPTVNKNAPKEIWNALSEIDLITMKGTPYFVFGSYGWSGDAVQLVSNYMKLLRLKQFDKPFGVLFNMSDSEREELITYTRKFMEETNEI